MMDDRLWGLGIGILMIFFGGLLWWSYDRDQANLRERCDAIMVLARSSRDTLDAAIACDRMHDDYDTRMAIGAAAAAAGAAAGSRR